MFRPFSGFPVGEFRSDRRGAKTGLRPALAAGRPVMGVQANDISSRQILGKELVGELGGHGIG
jgi:hypothetical protein